MKSRRENFLRLNLNITAPFYIYFIKKLIFTFTRNMQYYNTLSVNINFYVFHSSAAISMLDSSSVVFFGFSME